MFQNKNQGLKMADIDNNKLMGLLIIAEAGFLSSQEHIKERRGDNGLRPWVRKRDCSYAYNHFSKKHWQPFL